MQTRWQIRAVVLLGYSGISTANLHTTNADGVNKGATLIIATIWLLFAIYIATCFESAAELSSHFDIPSLFLCLTASCRCVALIVTMAHSSKGCRAHINIALAHM